MEKERERAKEPSGMAKMVLARSSKKDSDSRTRYDECRTRKRCGEKMSGNGSLQ